MTQDVPTPHPSPAAAAAAPPAAAGGAVAVPADARVRQPERLALAAAALAVVVGVVARAWLVFGDELPRGINGGYYPVQARAVLRSGSLALPDLPLLFYLQAALAAILGLVMPDRGQAILLATRLADTVLPCLIVVPVLLLARSWVPADRRRQLPVVVLAAGLVAVVNGSALRMVGDLQKNSAALGLALLFVYFADRYLRDGGRRAALGALVCLGLTGVTHLGVFGMTLLLAALLAGLTLVADPRRRRLWPALLVTAGVCLAVGLAVFAFFDAERIERLASYALAPLRFLRPPQGPPLGPGPGFPGRPGGAPPWLAMAQVGPEGMAGLGLGLMGVWMWLQYVGVERVQRRTALAGSLAALALVCPWLNPDMGHRLALMAFVPGLVALVFALAHWPRLWACAVAGALVVTVSMLGSLRSLSGEGAGGLSRQARLELAEIARQIPNPGRSLIIARHGLEWWAAWYTNARIANNVGAAIPGWETYERVYSLVELNGPQSASPLLGPRGGPGPGGLASRPGAALQGPPGQGFPGPGPDAIGRPGPGADPRLPLPPGGPGQPPDAAGPWPDALDPGPPGPLPEPPAGRPAAPWANPFARRDLPPVPADPDPVPGTAGAPSAWANPFRPPPVPGADPGGAPDLGGPRPPFPELGPGTPPSAGPPGLRGGPPGGPPGPPLRTEPVFSGQALRLDRVLEKPPVPRGHPGG